MSMLNVLSVFSTPFLSPYSRFHEAISEWMHLLVVTSGAYHLVVIIYLRGEPILLLLSLHRHCHPVPTGKSNDIPYWLSAISNRQNPLSSSSCPGGIGPWAIGGFEPPPCVFGFPVTGGWEN